MKVSFSVSTQAIFMKFFKPFFQSFDIYPENFVKQYCIVQKLDRLTCSKMSIYDAPL